MAFRDETDLEEIAYFRVVLDDKNRSDPSRVMVLASNTRHIVFGASQPSARRLFDFNREDRPLAELRANCHRMVQQSSEPSYDREAKAKPRLRSRAELPS